MSRERDRPRIEDRVPAGPSEVPAPLPAPELVATVLGLQRSAGNAAVARALLRKDDKPKTEPPRPGGWNEAAREVAGTIRIPVTSITAGHQQEDPQLGQTKESAGGKATVIVPRSLDVTKKVDVLLFFHGMGNAGYRERTKDHATRGKEGTVHDVEVDRIPQQITAAGGQVVGVLPQGTDAARFGIADPDAYVKEALALATPAYQKEVPKPQLPGPIEHARIIVAGHSGGGRAALIHTQKLESSATEDKWAASPPLILFDGINGTAELANVADWVAQSLAADKAILGKAADPKALLKRRALKLLSTYTAGARYEALNHKGSYVDELGATITISEPQGLRARVDAMLKKADAAYRAELRAQYVIDGPVAGGHEQTVGTGKSPEGAGEKRLPAPTGLKDKSKDAGVPDYKGGGNVEKALKKVYPPAKMSALPPVEAPLAEDVALTTAGSQVVATRLLRQPAEGAGGDALLEADWLNPAYASSHDKFAGEGRPSGKAKERYLKLAPLYKAHGIDRPLKWAHENITSVTFFGSTTPAHKDLKSALIAAEADLRKQGHSKKPFNSCWAFNPRTTSKGGWSNHADGKAIDIDADNNPHFTDLRQKKVINALTGMDITAENPGDAMGMTTYDAIAEMSKRFSDRFSPEGMEERIAELEADEERLAAEEAAIKAELGALPKPKRGRLTPDERKAAAEVEKQAKELTKAIAAKHGQVTKAQERQDLLGEEKTRFDKVHTQAEVQRWRIAELITEIYEIEKEIDKLEAQIAADEAALGKHEDRTLLTKEVKKLWAEADKERRAKILKGRKAVAALAKDRRAKHTAIAAAEAKIDTLHRWGSDGFMDLEPHLVTALKKAGLSWGGEWAGSKDLMHFEVAQP